MTKRIDYTKPSRHHHNVYQVIALELAIGSSLPDGNVLNDWPLGLACEWNKAADAGAFDEARTIGDMAKAYLRFRLERMGAAPEPAPLAANPHIVAYLAALDAQNEPEETYREAHAIIGLVGSGRTAGVDKLLRSMDTSPREHLMDALAAAGFRV